MNCFNFPVNYSFSKEISNFEKNINNTKNKNQLLLNLTIFPLIVEIAKVARKTINEEKKVNIKNNSGFPFAITTEKSLEKSIQKINKIHAVIEGKEQVKKLIEKFLKDKNHIFYFKYSMKDEELDKWIKKTYFDFVDFNTKHSFLTI